jgi:phospholipase/lecithinase/hemolysin
MTLAESETDNPIPYDVSHQAKVYKTSFNAALAGKIQELAKQLNVKIDLFDFTAIEERIHSNPENYGLTNLTDSCSLFPHGVGPACAKPDEYYYWGPYYLTRVVNKIIGEAMAEQLSK